MATTSNGGGATHIAKVTGQLKDLSSNLSDILMVSGGGGGGLISGDTDYSGKEAGGISGSGDNSADQSTGNAFGQGESGTNVSGGGSGLYGGYKGTSSKSGGAGSGYIGNSLLSNKKMVGYNVPTSSAESTKTESINEVSASAVSGKPKSGNGFARIKLIREAQWVSLENMILRSEDFDTHFKKSTLGSPSVGVAGINDLSSYFNTEWTLKGANGAGILYSDKEFSNQQAGLSDSMFIPLKQAYRIYGVRGSFKIQGQGSNWDCIFITLNNGHDSTIQEIDAITAGKVPTESSAYNTDRWHTISDDNYNDITWQFDSPMGSSSYGYDTNYINVAMATRYEWVKNLEFLVI